MVIRLPGFENSKTSLLFRRCLLTRLLLHFRRRRNGLWWPRGRPDVHEDRGLHRWKSTRKLELRQSRDYVDHGRPLVQIKVRSTPNRLRLLRLLLGRLLLGRLLLGNLLLGRLPLRRQLR